MENPPRPDSDSFVDGFMKGIGLAHLIISPLAFAFCLFVAVVWEKPAMIGMAIIFGLSFVIAYMGREDGLW